VPPSNVPNAELLNATTDSIDLYIDTVGVSGNTPITYTGLFGVTPGGWTANLNYALSTGTIYTATAATLPSSTTYYFGTVAQNAFGTVSTIAPFPAYSTLSGVQAPTAPTAPQPSVDNLGGLMSTFYFDVAGVTGTAPITYDFVYNTTGQPLASTIATLSTGTTIYSGVVNAAASATGLDVVIYSRSSNAVGSVLSDNTSLIGSTVATALTGFSSTINLGAGLASQSAISLQSYISSAVCNPRAEIFANFGTVSSSLISTTGNFNQLNNPYTSTLANLPSSTTFYFNSVAYNAFGSTVNTNITALSTIA
jgi:hypothetical protein